MAEEWLASGSANVSGEFAATAFENAATTDGRAAGNSGVAPGADVRENVMRMYQYVYGNWFTMLTYVYAELDLARLLRESPRTAAQLAEATGTNPKTLERVLRCAGAIGFHTTDPATGVLRPTDFGLLLCADSPHSLRAAARLNGAPYRYEPWGRLLEYVRAGSGRGLSPTWEDGSLPYLKERPELLEVFEEAMTNLSRAAYTNVDENRVIARAFDFGRFASVLDVGGGNGSLIEEILLAHRGMRGAIFDLEDVVANVSLPAEGHPNAGRVEKIAGDYSHSIPAGFDAYIMKNVIHNSPEHKCRTMLENIRHALVDGGREGVDRRRLILFELVMPDRGEGDMITKLVDLNMNLLVDGSDRTARGYEALLNDSGFELLGISDLPDTERKAIEAAVAA